MARIKRYISDVEPLIRSEQASVMSPQQAAATEQAKYRTVTDAANLGVNIAAQFAEIRDEEQLNSATAQYEAAVAEIDRSVEEMAPEVDEDGNLTYTPNRIRHMSEQAESAIYDSVRGQMTSKRATRAFDDLRRRTKQQRTEQLNAKEMELEANFMRVNTLISAQSAADAGLFDVAEQTINRGTASGAIEPLEGAKKLKEFGRAADIQYGYNVLLTGDVEELDEAMTAFTVGVHPEYGEMTLTEQERYTVKKALAGRYKDLTEPDGEAQKGVQRATFAEMYQRSQTPEGVSEQEVMDEYARGNLSDGQLTKMIGVMRGAEGVVVSDTRAAVALVDGAMWDFLEGAKNSGTDYTRAREDYVDYISRIPGLTAATRTAKLAEFDARVAKVYTDPFVMSLRRSAFEAGAGFLEGELTNLRAKFLGQFNDMREIGHEFDRALILEAEVNPDRAHLKEWYEERKPTYQLKAVSGELRKVGVNYDWPLDERGELKALTDEDMDKIGQAMLPAMNQPGGGTRIGGIIDNIERLTGFRITTPGMGK